jgi:hypothetical protein
LVRFSVDDRIVEIVVRHGFKNCCRKPWAGRSFVLRFVLKAKGGPAAEVNYDSGEWFTFRFRARVIAA